MLTWNVYKYTSNTSDDHYGEGTCLSTDTKPTDGISNGSSLLEMDTGDVYLFNQDAKQWLTL